MPLSFIDSTTGENLMPPPVTSAIPADGDDMTWDELTLSRDTALLSESALAKLWADDDDELENDGYLALFIEVRAQKLMIDRLQNEMHGLAAQVVELREKVQAWEGDS